MKPDIWEQSPRLQLQVADVPDAAEYATYISRNASRFIESMPLDAMESFSDVYWARRIRQNREAFDTRCGVHLLGRSREDNRLVLDIAFSNVVRGVFCACHLGMKIDVAFEGQGLMLEALRVALPETMRRFGLHRVMANYRPENCRSRATLSAMGFEVEGFAKDYLYLNGAWRDHVLSSYIDRSMMAP